MFSKKLSAICCCGLLCVLTSFITPAFSQELSAAASPLQVSGWPDSVLPSPGADSRLYNGVEYIRNGTPAKGFPFWDVDSLRPGTVCYDGRLFSDVPMEYDIVEDKLIIPYYTGHPFISLINEKLSYFLLDNQRFRYIYADSSVSGLPATGFYQELSRNGANALLARREKKLVFPGNRDELARYTQHNSYFLLLDGHYWTIDDEKDLLEIAKDKKDALKQYIRKNKIRFKKNPEEALIQTTGYYLQIRK
ncbi:MAG TPA: hypothetical protein VGS79_13810 [Puia sp.]|nr:hypothetical protein [Puia sp.]